MSGLYQLGLREWAMTPLVILLAIVPGLGFAAKFARRARLSFPEAVGLAFAITVAWTSAVATIAQVLGLGLNVVVIAYVAAIPVSLWLLFIEGRAGYLGGLEREPWDFVFAGLAGVVAMLERPWFGASADTFYHLAATRSLLATNKPIVTDPFYGTATRALDPTSGAWHTVQAVLSRVLSTDIATLYLAITALGAALTVLSFWVLAKRVSGRSWAAGVATLATIAVAYHFDFRVAAYPKHISEGLVFLALALLIGLIDTPRDRWLAAAAVIVGFATVTMHLASAEFMFLCGGMLLAWLVFGWVMERGVCKERYWADQISAVGSVLGLALVASLPVLLPRLAVLAGFQGVGAETMMWLRTQVTHIGSIDLVSPGAMYTGGPLVYWGTLALAVLLLPAAFRDRNARALGALALLTMVPLLLTNPFVTPLALERYPYMTARLAALMRFLPFVAVAWALPRARHMELDASSHGGDVPGWQLGWRGRFPTAASWAAIVLVVLALLSASPDLYRTTTGRSLGFEFEPGLDVYALGRTWTEDMRREWTTTALAGVRREFGDSYPVVATPDLDTGYYLAGLEPCAIVSTRFAHSPYAVEAVDGPERRIAMARFFDVTASEAERRALVAKWRIRYVAIWKTETDPATELSLLAQPRLFKPVVTSDEFDLLAVVAASPKT